jgi:hypothetical protein
MKHSLLAIVGVFLASASLVWADIPSPRPAPVKDGSVPMVIETVDGRPAPARLVIPKKLMGQMKAGLDTHDDTAVAHGKTSRLSMFLAGIFLTLSVSCTGLWLSRQRLVGPRTVAIILVGVALLSLGGAVLWANGPAPGIRPAPDTSDRVIIEVVDQGEAVKLIVHKSRLTKVVGVNGPNSGPIIGGPPVPAPAPQPKPGPGKPEVRSLPAPAPGGINNGVAPKEPIKE